MIGVIVYFAIGLMCSIGYTIWHITEYNGWKNADAMGVAISTVFLWPFIGAILLIFHIVNFSWEGIPKIVLTGAERYRAWRERTPEPKAATEEKDVLREGVEEYLRQVDPSATPKQIDIVIADLEGRLDELDTEDEFFNDGKI